LDRQRNATSSTLIQQLLKHYGAEGLQVPYTIEDFLEDVKKETLEECTVEERLAGLTPQQIVQALSPQIFVQVLSAEDRLKGLSPEQVEDYLKKLKGVTGNDQP
jgi:hypothetical protein